MTAPVRVIVGAYNYLTSPDQSPGVGTPVQVILAPTSLPSIYPLSRDAFVTPFVQYVPNNAIQMQYKFCGVSDLLGFT